MLLLHFHASPRTWPEEAVQGKGRIIPTHPASIPPRARRFNANGRSQGGPAYPERFRRTGYQRIPSEGPLEQLRFPNLFGPLVPGSSSFRAREGLPKILPANGTDGSARRKSHVGRRNIRHSPEPPLLFSSSGERWRSTLKPDEPSFSVTPGSSVAIPAVGLCSGSSTIFHGVEPFSPLVCFIGRRTQL
jgi:hypothetical protein